MKASPLPPAASTAAVAGLGAVSETFGYLWGSWWSFDFGNPWGPLGSFWILLGPLGVLWGSFGGLGDPLRILGCPLGFLWGSLGAPAGPLEVPWRSLGGPLGSLGGLLEFFSEPGLIRDDFGIVLGRQLGSQIYISGILF